MDALGILVTHPWLALVVAAGLWALWSWRRRHLAALAAIAWLTYGAYEHLMLTRVLCSGECNIRVDLLAIYPALLALTVAAVVHSLKPTSAGRDAAT
jgi:hypothetical protein